MTDPESRIMKRSGSGFYSFNAQTAVDGTAHIIVAAEVVHTSSDVHPLPMVLMTQLAKELPATALVIGVIKLS